MACALGESDVLLLCWHSHRLKLGDSRFTTAPSATAPRRACLARNLFLAAFSSRSSTKPQEGQTGVRTDRRFSTRAPQPLQSWLVEASATNTTCLAAYAAVEPRM